MSTVGSRGEVEPMLALALALREQGDDAVLCRGRGGPGPHRRGDDDGPDARGGGIARECMIGGVGRADGSRRLRIAASVIDTG
ncbi:hypothetical protein EV378_3357 [Pseudonocardia endophytica]|uniref:Uncharacterized protein n=2 Tax=Pseudonocardia endophytica TaxID=401976 RepID=A0A4R1I1P0_PSEEN|nr:hypothetical protein EV378_3357 [Pseudonocardia endophytica]